jgi:hypothetical protein
MFTFTHGSVMLLKHCCSKGHLEDIISGIKAMGLAVSELDSGPDGQIDDPRDYLVAKPASVTGNSLKDYEMHLAPEGILLDMPAMRIFMKDGAYHAVVHEYIPGPGPGDFHNAYESAQELLSDIREYYFGNMALVENRNAEQ